MIMTESFHPHVLNELFSAFAELPYKVLWKANQTKFPMQKFPSNIQFETWMPQIDILCNFCALIVINVIQDNFKFYRPS